MKGLIIKAFFQCHNNFDHCKSGPPFRNRSMYWPRVIGHNDNVAGSNMCCQKSYSRLEQQLLNHNVLVGEGNRKDEMFLLTTHIYNLTTYIIFFLNKSYISVHCFNMFIPGIAAWLGGLLINMHSDYILRNLRKPGETVYKIPRGGMFEYVSGANFFGEIIEWCGFALACNTAESTAFAITTLLLLGNRAYWHHQWYLNKFEDYPRSRKILIPFVF
uniref:Steroid 5 alpha-reductase 1 n=1 Tax=Pseudonaja textilis TaxID=8673 RepID=A0A670Y9R9_PSETE